MGVVTESGHLILRPSPIHGIGGFARTDLGKGTLVVEYVGESINKAQSLARCRGGNP